MHWDKLRRWTCFPLDGLATSCRLRSPWASHLIESWVFLSNVVCEQEVKDLKSQGETCHWALTCDPHDGQTRGVVSTRKLHKISMSPSLFLLFRYIALNSMTVRDSCEAVILWLSDRSDRSVKAQEIPGSGINFTPLLRKLSCKWTDQYISIWMNQCSKSSVQLAAMPINAISKRNVLISTTPFVDLLWLPLHRGQPQPKPQASLLDVTNHARHSQHIWCTYESYYLCKYIYIYLCTYIYIYINTNNCIYYVLIKLWEPRRGPIRLIDFLVVGRGLLKYAAWYATHVYIIHTFYLYPDTRRRR